MADSGVSLAPRGVGRSAFHLAVTVQIEICAGLRVRRCMFEELGHVLKISDSKLFFQKSHQCV